MKNSLQKRKLFLALPLLVIPFLTMAFYALGGGGKKENAIPRNELNLQLPASDLKEDKTLDKLAFYDKAERDSMRLAEWMRTDPFFQQRDSAIEGTGELEKLTEASALKYNQRLNLSPYEREQLNPGDDVLMKLKLLQDELNRNNEPSQNKSNQFGNDIDRLETMMRQMKNENEEDKELMQMSNVMEKILDVQHPERVKERSKEGMKQMDDQTFKVTETTAGDTTPKEFYGISRRDQQSEGNSFRAVVHEEQQLVNGSIIKLRLLDDIFIEKNKIAAGNFIFGIVRLNGERLEISIQSIRSAQSLYHVRLAVFDMDGLPGIHIPGAITKDAVKQSADDHLQRIGIATLDPSLKAQVTSAGISTLKNILGKKMKIIKVIVKAGYGVLLKNEETL